MQLASISNFSLRFWCFGGEDEAEGMFEGVLGKH